MLRYLTYAILAYIAWKLIRLIRLFASVKSRGGVRRDQPVDIPKDQAYKNIEDANFEDITGDSDKPS